MKTRLFEIRLDLEMTQAILANELGISRMTYVRYEKGERNIPSDVLIKLAELGYDVNWLLTGAGNMRIEEPSDEIVKLRKENQSLRDEVKKIDDFLEQSAERRRRDSRNPLPGIEGA